MLLLLEESRSLPFSSPAPLCHAGLANWQTVAWIPSADLYLKSLPPSHCCLSFCGVIKLAVSIWKAGPAAASPAQVACFSHRSLCSDAVSSQGVIKLYTGGQVFFVAEYNGRHAASFNVWNFSAILKRALILSSLSAEFFARFLFDETVLPAQKSTARYVYT